MAQSKTFFTEHKNKFIFLGSFFFIVIFIELFVFNSRYISNKFSGLEERYYSIDQGSLSQYEFTNGKLITLNNDPNIIFDNIDLPVATILIDCIDSTGTMGQVFYRNSDEIFNEHRSIRYDTPLADKTLFLDQVLEFPKIVNVSSLRFDLTEIAGDVISCEGIVVNPHVPFKFSRVRLVGYLGVWLLIILFIKRIIKPNMYPKVAAVVLFLALSFILGFRFSIRPENYVILFSIIAILFELLSRDKKFLISLKSDFLDFYSNNQWYWIAIAITTLLSYGFTLANYSVSVDDEAFMMYYQGGGLLAQGRFGASHFLRYIFDAFEFLPFWADALGLIVFIIATVFWSIYFIRMSYGMLEKKYVIVFSCLSISFPVIAYLFVFSGAIYVIGFTFLFTGIALILVASWLDDAGNNSSLYPLLSLGKVIAAIFFLAISIGILEWTTALFLSGVFSGLLLKYICDDAERKKAFFRFFLFTAIKTIIVLALAIALKEVLVFLYQQVNDIVPYAYTSHLVLWKVDTILYDFPKFMTTLVRVFFTPFYKGKDISLWLGVFNFSIIIDIFLAIYLSIKNKNIISFIIVIFMIGSAFSLNVITGNAFLELRTYVHLAVPVAFTFMLLTYLIFEGNWVLGDSLLFVHKSLKIAVTIVVVLIVLYQTKEMTRYFYFEKLRYDADIRIAYNIMDEIEKQNGSLNKPVVFIGPFSNSANIRFGYVFFSHDRWTIPERMMDGKRILGFFRQLGYNMRPVSLQSDLDIALNESQNMPSYPKDGSIKFFDSFVVVKFGNIPMPLP
jgi:hypothetical protein